jgi:hypothetical protein
LEAQPTEGTLHDPAPGQDLEAFDVVGPFHDRYPQASRAAKRGYPTEQRSRVAAVRPDQAKPHQGAGEGPEYQFGSVAVLDVGGMDDHAEHQSQGIDDQVTLASTDFLARIVTADPPLDVVLTDWLSMMAADGIRSRPSLCLTSPRSLS